MSCGRCQSLRKGRVVFHILEFTGCDAGVRVGILNTTLWVGLGEVGLCRHAEHPLHSVNEEYSNEAIVDCEHSSCHDSQPFPYMKDILSAYASFAMIGDSERNLNKFFLIV